MKSKKTFWFNESKRAEEILLNGFPDGNIDRSKMYLVAKYFRHEMGYGKVRMEKAIIEFCKEQDSNFNPVVERDFIKSLINTAYGYNLRVVKKILITQNEIDFLKEISNPRDRKVLFVTLVVSKALKKQSTKISKKPQKKYEHCYIHYGNLSGIIKWTKLSNLTESGIMDIFNKYLEHLTPYSPEKELIRIDYADTESEEGLWIDDFENLDEYYDWLFGKNSILCERCGKPITRKVGNQKYCEKCSVEARRDRQKEIMRKRRQ